MTESATIKFDDQGNVIHPEPDPAPVDLTDSEFRIGDYDVGAGGWQILLNGETIAHSNAHENLIVCALAEMVQRVVEPEFGVRDTIWWRRQGEKSIHESVVRKDRGRLIAIAENIYASRFTWLDRTEIEILDASPFSNS